MSKRQFLAALQKGLIGLPQDDIKRSIDFYGEMIDDRIEEGLTEEDAIEAVGSVDDIVAQTLSEIPLAKLVKAKVRTESAWKAWEIALLILGSPVWFPLFLAAAIIVLAVYVVIWSVNVSLYAVNLSLAISGIACIIWAFVYVYISSGNFAGTALFFGIGLVCTGISILLLSGFNQLTKGLLLLSRRLLIGIKSLFVRKGKVQ